MFPTQDLKAFSMSRSDMLIMLKISAVKNSANTIFMGNSLPESIQHLIFLLLVAECEIRLKILVSE